MASIQNADMLGRVTVQFVNSETNEEIKLDSDVYTLIVKDSENRTVKNLYELLFDNYKVNLKVNTLDYLALNIEESLRLSADNREVVVTFRLKPQKAFDVVFSPVLYPEIDSEASSVYLLATNQ